MKNKIYFALILILFLSPISLYAQNNKVIKNRQLLKNYGIAYCVYKFGQGEWIKQDTGAAQSLYFQAGSYDGEALRDIQHYIHQAMAASKEADSENNPLIFHKCLTIYNSEKYRIFIKGLDKYL